MRLASSLFVFAVLASGCALRPRYADFISPSTAGREARFVLTDRDTAQPLPNVRVEISELKTRYSVTTGADGAFALPVDAKYISENPVVVVTLPAGVKGYVVTPAPAPAPAAPPSAEPAPSNG